MLEERRCYVQWSVYKKEGYTEAAKTGNEKEKAEHHVPQYHTIIFTQRLGNGFFLFPPRFRKKAVISL